MRHLWALLLAVAALTLAAPAYAEERIEQFNVAVNVARNGDIVVTEAINVTAEGVEIRHGIQRDLPRYYEKDGERLPFEYDILSVELDGHPEHYDTSHEDNAFRVRIGDEDDLVSTGPHAYVIRYRVKNQVRYFDRHDEVYWNATGNFWTLPIQSARAVVTLPPGAQITQTAGYTGAIGTSGHDFTYTQSGDDHIFATTRAMAAGEGLTVAVGFAKGLIDPPSSADVGWLWWQRNGALAILLGSLAGLFWFLYRAWTRVGRDPARTPVFPRYEAPADFSPAATHHVFYRGLQGNRALIATLMNLAVKGRLKIDASEKKSTTLTLSPSANDALFAPEDRALERAIFGGAQTKTFGGKYDAEFTAAYEAFKAELGRKYGSPYFRWNVGYTLFALTLTIVLIVFAASNAPNWSGWHTLLVLALAALNIAFMYFMPAATPLGQTIRSEIQGLKLYLETAEKLQLNAVEVGSEAPPPMTTERYEKFLPYAVALGVEAPWTKHFERLLPAEAAAYSPAWGNSGWSTSHSFASLSQSLVSNIDSGVSSAMPQSSSSSGSGGGGSSGGGGGGGGGSGW